MAPVLRPSIRSRFVFEDVTETVVPGHTRTSPPADKRRIAVSDPAVIADPEPIRLPANTKAPEPLVTGITAGAPLRDRPDIAGCNATALLAFISPAGLR